MDRILSVIGIIIALIELGLNLHSSKNPSNGSVTYIESYEDTRTVINNRTTHHHTYEKTSNSDDDFIIYLVVAFIIAVVYYEYKDIIATVGACIGIVSIFSLIIFLRYNKSLILARRDVLILFTSYALLFTSNYLFMHPVITVEYQEQTTIGLENVAYAIYEMVGIGIVFLGYLYYPAKLIIEKLLKRSKLIKVSLLFMLISIVSISFTSGLLLDLITKGIKR